MIAFKIVRKIGRMLRGGAGRKEIFLGALCGVLIGFNPVAGLTLALMILITLLLNANIGFTLLGILLGKVLALLLSVVSFHTGYFLIHKIGLEGLFTKLVNAPVTALMDLDVYAMIGGLPYAILIGIAFGRFMSATVTRIREQMLKAGEHEKVGKAVGNKVSRVLMWLVFGKQKLSTADVLAKESPLLRKSGFILVGSVVVIGLVLQFFLLDLALKKGLQAAISARTGAEVNIGTANLSLATGALEIGDLQVTDPDKLTHNLVQLDALAADISVGDLLRKTYTIDLLKGGSLQRDVPRETPGKLLIKEAEPEEEVAEAADEAAGKSLDDYFTQAKKLKKYGSRAYDYLQQRKDNGEAVAKGEKPKAVKKTAVADAKRIGYLKAAADLVSTRPAWLIRKVEIDDVRLDGDFPAQSLEVEEISSHPELSGEPTRFIMTPVDGTDPTAKLVLRFDDPAAPHEIETNLKSISIGDSIKTGDSLKIEDGKADISANGTFSVEALNIPFTIFVRDLKTDNEMLNALKQLEIGGSLGGTLLSPRVQVALSDNLKSALGDAAKAKAKEMAKGELNKALQSEEAEEAKAKAKDALKKLF
ncbi:MAG: DUF2062 domain-containing protein [Kiritimatiellales bacterium]|nr:DUF2062 domain-containing protein [Kiritimatiellales bacterium]